PGWPTPSSEPPASALPVAYTGPGSRRGGRALSNLVLLLVSLGYAALLFAVAWWGDRNPGFTQRPGLRPIVYSLALAVYCSSWTFYGAVGTAARNGIGYLPIYLRSEERRVGQECLSCEGR